MLHQAMQDLFAMRISLT